ncbi:hypothetical protein EYZ11_000146 [Aspergillus tanneri]|uniref:Uncharacterized protein n=1 Tax=Aspergillus tanneri TaxID=1220188 RepID=A0A4S3JXZ2_9EURO|nr:uncharacterized protein ATNIH1004_005647 [Aspergillus tanneri]KAA8646968.1 hypothetical protein ATNIH1004_005647 [Aspergillus tanneri]THD00419.1 hypothetical protein EYZ11_000146 [Aspergillus tanneri]
MDEIPDTWDDFKDPPPHLPIEEEIDIILRPWRSDEYLRTIASQMFKEDNIPVLLRTYYNPEDAGKINEWAADKNLFERNDTWNRLDDPEFFNLGPDWRHDLLQRGILRDSKNNPKFLIVVEAEASEGWSTDPEKFIENCALRLQTIFVKSMLLIADQEAFQTGNAWLLFLDGQRNIIREGRVNLDKKGIDDIAMDYDQTSEMPEELNVGKKYKLNGEIGKDLYRLTNRILRILDCFMHSPRTSQKMDDHFGHDNSKHQLRTYNV